MEAQCLRTVVLAVAIGSLGAGYRTQNFVVNAPTAQMAEQIGRAAERYRKELALDWLGHEMPAWAQPCPITAHVAENLGAGGATSFLFEHGDVFGWRMTIQGSLVRILDSVLPHEVTHTVFATHFRQPLPRWADEGACTTVEYASERAKQQTMLIDFLRSGRGIAFNRMFAMKEYPHDVMPLYSQGYSVACYLIGQGGKRKFLEYLSDGLKDENWARATAAHYPFSDLGALQNAWLGWVRQGSPPLDSTRPSGIASNALAKASRRPRPEPNLIYRAHSADEASAASLASYDAAASDGPTTYLEPRRTQSDAGDPSGDTKLAGASSTPGWHPRDRSLASRDDAWNDSESVNNRARLNPEPIEHQVTRPQGVQKSRQIILEWNRPQAQAEPPGSVYSRPLND